MALTLLEELGKKERKNKYLCLKFNTMKKIEQSELDQITKANSDFAQIKETIANVEIQKHQSLHSYQLCRLSLKPWKMSL